MRSLFLLLPVALLASCSPSNDGESAGPKLVVGPAVRADQYPGNSAPPPSDEPALPPDPLVPRHPIQSRVLQAAGTSLTLVSFDTRSHRLAVFDQANGPGAEVQTAQQATRSKGALAGINGGFFTPEGAPLGLVFESGTRLGSPNSSSLGSGVLYVDKKLARPVIARRETFQQWLENDAFEPLEVLQAGPFLIENGSPVPGLSDGEARIRSLLLWDGESHFAIAQSGPISLKNLAGALASQPVPGFRIKTALNLDGGRSSDLFISSKIKGGPLSLRRWWNKPVRNYVLLFKQ